MKKELKAEWILILHSLQVSYKNCSCEVLYVGLQGKVCLDSFIEFNRVAGRLLDYEAGEIRKGLCSFIFNVINTSSHLWL